MCICDLRKRTRTYMHYIALRWCGMKYRCRLISNAENSGTAFRKFPAEGETFTTVEVVSVTIRRIRVHVYDAGQNCVDRNEFIANVQEIVVIVFLGKIWDFNLCFANLFRLWSVIKESFNVECYRKCIQCIYKLRINLYHLANPHVENFLKWSCLIFINTFVIAEATICSWVKFPCAFKVKREMTFCYSCILHQFAMNNDVSNFRMV